MKFENKGKWLKQIVEAKGVTINGIDDIELDFDTRQGLVYITINGDLTYKVDEDKFMNNVSDFVYDEVDKDKTKFNLNWDKHFGKLNRYLRKTESSGTADLKVLLDLSLSEENKAVADYEARALKCERHGNIKAAKLFHELAKDERVHVAQLTEAKRLFELNDPTTDEEGSQEAKELLTESSQKNEAPDPYKSSNYKYLKFKKNANGKTIMEAPAFDKVSSIVVHDRLFGEEVFLDNGYGSNGKLGNMVVRTARQMGLTIKDSSKNNNLWVYMDDNEIPAFYNRLDANIKEFI